MEPAVTSEMAKYSVDGVSSDVNFSLITLFILVFRYMNLIRWKASILEEVFKLQIIPMVCDKTFYCTKISVWKIGYLQVTVKIVCFYGFPLFVFLFFACEDGEFQQLYTKSYFYHIIFVQKSSTMDILEINVQNVRRMCLMSGWMWGRFLKSHWRF